MKRKSFFDGFKEGFKEFSHIIINIVNFVLLTMVYIFGIGLVAIFSRISKKKFLNLKSNKSSYWEDNLIEKKPIEKYFRQF